MIARASCVLPSMPPLSLIHLNTNPVMYMAQLGGVLYREFMPICVWKQNSITGYINYSVTIYMNRFDLL